MSRIVFVVSCLVLFSVIGHAQQAEESEAITQEQQDTMLLQAYRAYLEGTIRPYWDRGGSISSSDSLGDAAFRSVLGITSEQRLQIGDQMAAAVELINNDIPEGFVAEVRRYGEDSELTLSF